MSFGLPIISTNTGWPKDILNKSIFFLLIPYGNKKAMILALERLLNNPRLSSNIGKYNKKYSNEFGWDNIVTKHIGLYQRILLNKKGDYFE